MKEIPDALAAIAFAFVFIGGSVLAGILLGQIILWIMGVK